MKKKLLSMLLIAAMAVTLVACGTDEKPSRDNNDNKKPTNTVADATDAPSTEAPVTPYEPGASGPTNATTETPEPEKNVITLLSADGSKVIHEFAIPKGYTVTSDKKSNHVVLAKDGDDTIKVELISGPCAEVLSSVYQYIPMDSSSPEFKWQSYPYNGTMSRKTIIREGDVTDEAKITEKIEQICNESGIDKKYFTQPRSDLRALGEADNHVCGYGQTMQYPAEYSPEHKGEWGDYDTDAAYFWDLSKHNPYSNYPITSYSYHYYDYINKKYIPADETFTIKITTTFDETKISEKHKYSDTIEEKIFDYIDDVSGEDLSDFIKDNFNTSTHTCEHCK